MAHRITRTVLCYNAKRVTLTTQKPMRKVIAALDKEVNSDGTGPLVKEMLESATSREDIESGMAKFTDNGKRDFVMFSTSSHSHWLNVYYTGERSFNDMNVYTIGNPLIARPMLAESTEVGLSVPLRLLVRALESGRGTSIVYDLPSSVLAPGEVGSELRKLAENLDDTLERAMRRVLS